MCRIVVGKGDQDHCYERNDGENKQADHRQREQRQMEFVVQQVVDVATEGLRLFANDVALLQLVAFLGTADVADDKENDLANMNSVFAINKKVKIEVGFTNTTKQYKNYEKIWFPLGVFVNIDPSISYGPQGATISMRLQDKMSLLNGDCGGVIPAQTTFDSYSFQDENGEEAEEKIKIYQIIQELVNHWGGEQLSKIVINDVPDQIKQIVKWTGDKPIYLHTDKETNKKKYVYTRIDDDDIEYLYGQDIGYQYTDFVYPGELTGEAGSSVCDVLDKIKTTLGNFEYYYDLNGNFIFQEIKDYANTRQVTLDLINMNKNDYIVDFFRSTAAYSLEDELLVTNYSNSPQLKEVKNDFVVWGIKEGVDGKTYPIRYHLAIDEKPQPMIFKDIVLYTDPPFAEAPVDSFDMYLNFPPERCEHYVLDEKGERKTDDNGFVTYFKDYIIKATKPIFIKDDNELPIKGRKNTYYYNITTNVLWGWDKDKNTFIENPYGVLKTSILANDWRTVLFLDGIETENIGTSANYYYAELANEWPLIYNIAKDNADTGVKKGGFRDDMDPTNLQFFLDFIEGSETLSDISISNIGRRSKVINDDKINCVIEREIPNFLLVHGDVEAGLPQEIQVNVDEVEYFNLVEIIENEKAGKPTSIYQLVPTDISNFAMGGNSNSAFDRIKELLWTHTSYNQSVTVSSLPIYHLEPNTRIAIYNSQTGIQGDYVIKTISLPFDISGTMSLNCTKAIDRI